VNPLFPGNKAALLAAAALSIVPAHFSFTFVEGPLQRSGIRRSSTLALAVMPLCVAVLTFIAAPNPFSELNLHLDAELGCETGEPSSVDRSSRCTLPVKDSIGQAILIGDSFAGQLAEGFAIAAHKLGLDATFATRAGQPLVASNGVSLEPGEDELLDAVVAQRPLVVVVAQSRYPTSLPEGVDWRNAFAPVVAILESTGIKVVLVNTSVMIGIEPKECSPASIFMARCDAEVVAPRLAEEEIVDGTLVDEWAAVRGSSAVVVDLLDVLCTESACPARREGKWMWQDSSHMSRYASELAAPILQAAMSEVLTRD
jgi:hypothetical protein